MRNETLGERLRRLRLASGLTQLEVAERSGVPLATLQGLEGDRREPGFRVAARLAKTLQATVEQLSETVSVDEVGKTPRPAGPSKRLDVPEPPSMKAKDGAEPSPQPKRGRPRKGEPSDAKKRKPKGD